jgi:hypothetical protein
MSRVAVVLAFVAILTPVLRSQASAPAPSCPYTATPDQLIAVIDSAASIPEKYFP